jgi:hypothetical protein
MHFIVFEEFIKNPKDEMCKIFNFLGVSAEDFDYKNEIINKTLSPRFPITLWFTRKIFGKGGVAWNSINYLNLLWKKPGYKKLDEPTRVELAKILMPHKSELEKIMGRKIAAWDKDFTF